MNYVTVHEIYDPAQIPQIKSLFENGRFDFRVIKEGTNDSMPQNWVLQVPEAQKEKAANLLLDAGFKRKSRLWSTASLQPKSRFWIFLAVTVIVIILVGIVVTMFMG